MEWDDMAWYYVSNLNYLSDWLTDWVSEIVTTREAIASKKEQTHSQEGRGCDVKKFKFVFLWHNNDH